MHYRIPMNLGAIMDGKDAETCSMKENIAQHLHMLLTTRMGENRFNPGYGNHIWQVEFENGISDGQWQEECKKAIEECIEHGEKRIKKTKVEVHTAIVEKEWPLKRYHEIKRRVTISIKAVIVESNENFSFSTHLFLSPMSAD
ncbi:GPW/gp25 family protein [Chitinophagaceae bacterium 26-R-25]|nr:GPW/gp25 family protein [Chitinophagaceae bacterium 26-R-25]